MKSTYGISKGHLKGYGRYLLIAFFSLVLALAFIPMAPQVALAAAGDILLSSSDVAGTQGNAGSFNPSITPGGRYVAFDSVATDLVPGGTTNSQIFRKDLWTGAVLLCSSNAAGIQGNNNSFFASISSDGRYVAFESIATDLVPGGTTNWQTFRKDLWTGTVVLCSSNAAGTQGNGNSFNTSISSDGRYVAFESNSTDLLPAPTANTQIFRKDLQTGAIVLCSSNAAGTQGNAGSTNASITADGRYVAFESIATDLLPAPTANLQIFFKDLQTGAITLCSSNAAGTQGNNNSFNASVNPDGMYVAFESDATDLLPVATTNRQIFRKDLMTGGIVLCSSDAAGNEGNAASNRPVISAEGRCVAFLSIATNLVPGGTTNQQVFRKDLQTGGIELCSSNAAGVQGNAASYAPCINSNGRYVAFDTDATDLFPTPTANPQVCRKELTLPLPTTWYLAEGYTGGSSTPGSWCRTPGPSPPRSP